MKQVMTPAAILLLAGCQSNEIGNSKDVNPEAIYQTYCVEATEGEPYSSFRAVFRLGGENGTSQVLNEKSYVSFDGRTLDYPHATIAPPETTKEGGTIYYSFQLKTTKAV